MIEFRCVQCGHTAIVKDEHAGKKARCPKCKTPGSIPAVSQPTAPTSPATPPGNHAVANAVKKCPHCGKEVPQAAVKCPHCEERANLSATVNNYYKSVPWYRRANWVDLMILLSLFCCCMGLLPACIITFTGPVYYKKIGEDGQLKMWGTGEKTVIAILTLVYLSILAISLVSRIAK